VSLFWWGILTVILANALRNRGNISVAFASTAPVLFVLAATAVLAMQLGVNSLGREGSALTWLRPILSGSQLLVRKLVVNGSYVLAHGFVYAAIAYTGSRLAALDTRFWILLSYAVLAGAVLSTLATALGFLLPDFERRSGFLPGATAAGKYAYLFAASLLVLMTGTAHLLLMAGRVDVAFYSGFLTFELICATAVTSLIAIGSVRQYRDMEI
jgi:hypothetical protein